MSIILDAQTRVLVQGATSREARTYVAYMRSYGAKVVAAVADGHGGEQIDGVTRFLGIPYAASPTGPRRFAAPEPPESWDGVRECIAFSATPPKPDYPAPFDTILP